MLFRTRSKVDLKLIENLFGGEPSSLGKVSLRLDNFISGHDKVAVIIKFYKNFLDPLVENNQ